MNTYTSFPSNQEGEQEIYKNPCSFSFFSMCFFQQQKWMGGKETELSIYIITIHFLFLLALYFKFHLSVVVLLLCFYFFSLTSSFLFIPHFFSFDEDDVHILVPPILERFRYSCRCSCCCCCYDQFKNLDNSLFLLVFFLIKRNYCLSFFSLGFVSFLLFCICICICFTRIR